jgi:pyruvyltransferase
MNNKITPLTIGDISYVVADDVVVENGAIPLTWWVVAPNFGDLLSPFLISKITNLPVTLINLEPPEPRRRYYPVKRQFSYLAIGSIIRRANDLSVVWGSGAFGTENRHDLNRRATYRAVRGPLTRNLLRINGIDCPEMYGDPALLLPRVFNPAMRKKYKVGLIVRWSEREWKYTKVDEGIKHIYLGSSDVEGVLTDILQCEKIVSSSLHGLILADAYKIPSAWLSSNTPKGLEFKFYDYFISVNKYQKPQHINFLTDLLKCADIESSLEFNDAPIQYNEKQLLDSCPFLKAS